ncbi:cytochrome-c peroxidase [Chitinophaga sp. Mgbs1]|uniref:Methylamine utilization protein MauG n=1 Tax=Chitinophaga solisilvae TaxID=1233460 RepID=A0A433WPU8_9BACT|nr:cytochrome-c peroxidase [Chitinophaga solisilvae]
MIRIAGILSIVVTVMLMSALTIPEHAQVNAADSLRILYARPAAAWPAPVIDSGVQWQELAALPADTASVNAWASDPKVQLGKLLFFDPRLSSSNQISCSSCHDPDLAWGDGRKVSLGTDHLQGTRNTPSLLNVWMQRNLFWDGRADGLESQAINPIATHHEMNMEPPLLPAKIAAIPGYRPLFRNAFGEERITLDRITTAIAAFERTIRSRDSRFDEFMKGRYHKMSDLEIKGLHLFRTKARCMNCHNGQYLTDGAFHNIGLTYYGRKYQDLGLYNISRDTADVGRFRTPSLRDVMLTRPWMHNGLFDDMEGILNIYNSGMPMKPKPGQENDALFPRTDKLIKPLGLTKEDKEALMAFLQALTGKPYKMPRPETLPQ